MPQVVRSVKWLGKRSVMPSNFLRLWVDLANSSMGRGHDYGIEYCLTQIPERIFLQDWCWMVVDHTIIASLSR